MKILHTSDWHLGINLGNISLIEDQEYFLKEIVKIIDKRKIDCILICGDIFNSRTASAGAIALYDRFITKVCRDMKKTVVVIAGNHDGSERLTMGSRLLEESGLYVRGRISDNLEPIIMHNCRIFPVPYFSRNEVEAVLGKKYENYEQSVKALMEYIKEKYGISDCSNEKKYVDVVMAHLFIVNAQLSESDRSARVGMVSSVSSEVFRGFDYVALGHIHREQNIRDNVKYSGTPMKYSFGSEEKHVKSVTIFNTETMETEIELITPFREMRTIEGTYEEILSHSNFADDFVKIIVTDRFAGIEIFSDMKAMFPHMVEFRGISVEEEGYDNISLTPAQLMTMDDSDILKEFIKEQYSENLDEEMEKLFIKTMNAWENRGELQ